MNIPRQLPASRRLEIAGQQLLLMVRGDPRGNRMRRAIDGCARTYVLATDQPLTQRRTLWNLTDPPPAAFSWKWPYNQRVSDDGYIRIVATRKAVLHRIAMGGLGIEGRLGPWNGSFWTGLRLSGALRHGPGTELRIWERQHKELVADLAGSPLMKRLEPKVAKHGPRRLRRCYAAFLPPELSTERSVLAGLFAGASLRDSEGETWLEMPDSHDVRAVLEAWGIPFVSLEHHRKRRGVRVSPLFGQLVMHLMPPHSARRMLSIQKAGGCPFLSAVLWKLAMSRRGRRGMPFRDALPCAVSRATHYRRGWHLLDLQRIGWLELGIRVVPKLRQLLEEWYQQKSFERQA